MRWLRKMSAGLVLGMVVVGIAYATLPDRYVKSLLIELVQVFTAEELEIGSLTLERGANPRLILTDVSWRSSAETPVDYRLTLGSVKTVVSLLSLLRGRVSIGSLFLSNAQLFVQDDGFESQHDGDIGSSLRLIPRWLDIGATQLAQVEIHYDNAAADRHYVVSLDTLDMPDGYTASVSEFSAKGSVNGVPLDVLLTVGDDPSKNKVGTDAFQRRVHFEASAGTVHASSFGTIDLSNDSLMLTSTVSAHAESLADLGSLIQKDWPALGPVELQATVSGELQNLGTQGLDIADLQIDLSDPTLQARLSGVVNEVPTSATASLQLSASAPDVAVITQLFAWPLPDQWGSIDATAQLEGSRGGYVLNGLDINLEGATSGHASGSLGSVYPMEGLQLDLDVTLATLAELSVYTPHELPDIGPVAATGVLSWQQGLWSLSKARATHGSALGSAAVTGNIGDLAHFDLVRLRANADLPDFSALMMFIDTRLPAVDHVQASANLISTKAGDLSARQLQVTTRRDELTIKGEGSIDSLVKNGGVLDLALSTSLDSLQPLDSLSGSSLPDIGPLDMTAQLSGSGKDIQLNDVNVTSQDASLSGTLQGDVGTLVGPLHGSFKLDLASTSLAATAARLGLYSTLAKPATLTGQLIALGNTLHLPDVELAADGNTISGDITLQHLWGDQARPQVRGKVDIDHLDLVELYAVPPGNEAEAQDSRQTDSTGNPDTGQGASKATVADRVFSEEVLPFDEIDIADIDIRVNIEELRSMLLEVSDAGFTATVDSGVLHIGSFSGTVNAGDVAFELTIDSTTLPPTVTVEATLDGVDLGRAGLFASSNAIENTGGSSLTLSLTGQGTSVAGILANANGEGGLYIEDLLFRKDALAWLSSDLLEQISRSLYTSSIAPAETRFQCTAMAFQIDKGVFSTPFGLGIISDNFSIIGNATVDLSTEQLQLSYSTKPKGGLGIGLNTVANVTTLKGPLKSPSLSLSQSGLLRFGATVGAAIASSGLSLLAEGVYEKYRANADVCAKAMGQ